MRQILCAVIALALLAGCSKVPSGFAEHYSADVGAAATADNPAAPADAAITVPQLAYDFGYTFSGPAGGVQSLVAADQAACDRAGVAQCQMISLSSDAASSDEYVRKTLELRVTPQWLKAWQAGLAASVAQAHGRIAQQSVTSEDLSLQMVDSEAHIKNQEALRDRLVEVIRTSPGKISDLVDAETQLADVQEEIDSAQSALAVMQKRGATVHLTLTYQSDAVAASEGTFAPLTDAVKDVLRNMMKMFAIIITVLSFLIPLAIVAAPVVWAVRRWGPKKKAIAVEPRTDPKDDAV